MQSGQQASPAAGAAPAGDGHAAMRVLVLSSDTPYPPNRGGRADVWRRILALRALGHQVMLVHLFEPAGRLAPRAEDLLAVDRVVAARFSLPIKRGVLRTLRQLAGAWHTPWHAATRIPDTAEMAELDRRLDAFAPTLVWLEGPWFGPLAQRVAAARGLRYAYRSHNIEHQYLWRQAAVAVRPRDRLAWRLACIGVRRLEQRLMAQAAAVFDISMDDLAYWRDRGVQRQHWLPPLPELAVANCAAAAVPGEVVFLGNLGTPNNVRGVEFLVREVWPLVRHQLPSARLALVGSNPTLHVRACIGACDGAELRENVTDPMAHVLGARVLVNPVMTGSGVQLKMLDMLMTELPIVSTAQGLRGLPADIAASVAVRHDAAGFAAAICQALSDGLAPAAAAARRQSRARFTVSGLGDALAAAGLGSGVDA